jgi:putative ABC transport system substrate-binding protein
VTRYFFMPDGPERAYTRHSMGQTGSRFGRRSFLQGTLAGAGLLVGCGVVPPRAQPAAKVPRIGFLLATTESAETARVEAFRRGLRELGYAEGQTLAIEWRWAEGQFDRLPALAAELVDLDVALIVAGGSTSTSAAQGATASVPIVMAQTVDPVGGGFVASLARPGGNITGLSTLAPGISGKRLELLKQAAPHLVRLAVLDNASTPGNAQALRETELAARASGVQLQYLDVRRPEEIERAFREMADARADALLALGSPLFILERRRMVDLAVQHRLPATYQSSEHVRDGGLMTYSVSIDDLYRRAATYVDKILKGAKPADLPVEQPTKFDFVINLQAARAIGLTIPQAVLQQATEIIE